MSSGANCEFSLAVAFRDIHWASGGNWMDVQRQQLTNSLRLALTCSGGNRLRWWHAGRGGSALRLLLSATRLLFRNRQLGGLYGGRAQSNINVTKIARHGSRTGR